MAKWRTDIIDGIIEWYYRGQNFGVIKPQHVGFHLPRIWRAASEIQENYHESYGQ